VEIQCSYLEMVSTRSIQILQPKNATSLVAGGDTVCTSGSPSFDFNFC